MLLVLPSRKSVRFSRLAKNFFDMIRRVFLGFLLLAQAGCPGHLAVNNENGPPEKIGEIKIRLATLRGLEFTDEIPIIVKNKDEVLEYLEADIQENYGEEKLKNISLAYEKLGLLSSGTDLKNSLLNFYSAQAVSFYDPKTKKIVLLDESGLVISRNRPYDPAESPLDKMALVHELTHALQDQHFSLSNRVGPSDNDDKALALRAMVEGDAILTEFAYRFGEIDQRFPAQINRALQNSSDQLAPIFSDIPAAIGDKLLFQYGDGASFVYRFHKGRGWPGINSLYSFPPLSTEQVLHPEKYLDLPDPPTRIHLKNLSSLFPSEWREVENNTLGELMVQCLMKEFFSLEDAIEASNGWDGDRFVAFRRGTKVSFIWASVWDSPKDTEEFARKFQEIFSRKYSSSHSQFYMEQRGNLIVVVEGLERAHTKIHINKIFHELKLEEEPFTLPFVLSSVS